MNCRFQSGWARLALLAAALSPVCSHAGPLLHYTRLDFSPAPDAVNTYGLGINDSGQIVGYFWDAALTGNQDDGFLYDAGRFTAISRPNQVATDLYGINDSGSMVGSDEGDNSFLTFYGLRTEGNTTLISDNPVCPPLNEDCGNASEFYGISNHGTIVGEAALSNSNPVQGLIYQPGVGARTFLVDNRPVDTSAHGVNDFGTVVGFYHDTTYHGFIDQTRGSEDHFRTLDYPGAMATYIYGINDGGTIVGAYEDSDLLFHGFIYSGGTFTSYDYVPSGADSVQAINTFFAGINDKGDVVGWFYGTDGLNHAFVAIVPEPAAWTCLLAGVLLLVRRKGAVPYFSSSRNGRTSR